MVPGTHNDVPLVRMASRHHYGPLLTGGVKIYEYQPTMLHTKAMVVDGLFSTIGSINFDERSMSKNAEESLSFYDRKFADLIEAMFQRDLKRCREVTYDAWKHRGSTARFAEAFSRIWEPYY
jgi:cardiolipin synthase